MRLVNWRCLLHPSGSLDCGAPLAAESGGKTVPLPVNAPRAPVHADFEGKLEVKHIHTQHDTSLITYPQLSEGGICSCNRCLDDRLIRSENGTVESQRPIGTECFIRALEVHRLRMLHIFKGFY